MRSIRNVVVGDWIRFRSGPRKVVDSWAHGLCFVQLRDGVIGNYRSKRTRPHWRAHKVADGVKTTSYTWSDLARMGATV